MAYDPEKVKDEIEYEEYNHTIRNLYGDDNIYFEIACARFPETNTKNMYFNRIRRIKYLNLEVYKDPIDEGFQNWELIACQALDGSVKKCICGMELEKECYLARRKHKMQELWGGVRLGSECVKKLDEYYGTKTTNEKLKKCSCGKRKNLRAELCKACIETEEDNKREIERRNKQQTNISQDRNIQALKMLESKLIKFPSNAFYISLKAQYERKGYFSDKQMDCIFKK